jgi:hypothetical protein
MFIVKKRRITKYKACVKCICNPVNMPVKLKGKGVAINLREESTSLALSLAWLERGTILVLDRTLYTKFRISFQPSFSFCKIYKQEDV